MKKRRNKILASILLLLTFIAGQVIVFAHNHKAETAHSVHYSKKNKTGAIDTKCNICAQNGHVQLFLQTQQLFFWSVSSTHSHVTYAAIYQSVKLLLSGNRGPPEQDFCSAYYSFA